MPMQAVRAARDALWSGCPQQHAYILEGVDPIEAESALSKAIRDHGARLRRSFDFVADEVCSAVSMCVALELAVSLVLYTPERRDTPLQC
jgi:hypothetical protein